MSIYQTMIKDTTGCSDYDAHHIEHIMRETYSTLDSITKRDFNKIAKRAFLTFVKRKEQAYDVEFSLNMSQYEDLQRRFWALSAMEGVYEICLIGIPNRFLTIKGEEGAIRWIASSVGIPDTVVDQELQEKI